MSTEPVSLDLDRRSFMKASALAGAVALGGGGAGRALAQSDEDGVDATDTEGELTKTICNFCAVGCGFHGERKGDAFVGQEPWHENPINNGSLCSKGAAIYESEHSEKRLKHPLKKVDGEWRKISWDDAYAEVTENIEKTWEQYGRDSVMILGSAHHSNEEAYAIRKLASFMGTNNIDHQARICHSTTVAGLANTWGFGAMTNTINDYRNFDLDLIIGQNPAEAHPIAMQHILEGQKRGGKIISVDARFTKTSAQADEFYRIRPGTDAALMMGLIKYLRDNNELNQEFLQERIQGWPDIEAELDQYDLDTVADITWIDKEDIKSIGKALAENKPQVQIEWAMGGTQHNNGTQHIRSYAMTAAATGGLGKAGGGLQVMRGHSNVQGATDLAVASHILPGYYGVGSVGSWDYWSKVWNQSPFTSGSLSFGELYDRFDKMPMDKYLRASTAESPEDVGTAGTVGDVEVSERSMMLQNGLTVARWFEAALPKEDRLHDTPIYQPNEVNVAFYWGHSSNSISEVNKQREAIENLDLLVVVDLFPSLVSALPDTDNIIILPAASQYEHYRSLTNSHRSVQWSQPVRPPGHNTKPDMQIMQELADHLGFGEHFDWGSGPEMYNGKSTYEEALREINLGVTSIGYRQDPERLQQHLEYDYAFSTEDTRAHLPGSPVDGEWWMLPWPCWGEGHPGTPIIWRDTFDPREGGQDIAADWGVKAPTPEQWEDMNTSLGRDQEYPLQNTVEQQGEEGLDMLRAPFDPDEVGWDTGFHDTVHGVPRYPGMAFALPDDPSDSDALTVPLQYALDPDKSVYDAVQATNEKYEWANYDEEFYEQYDYAQPDPPTGRGRGRAVAWNFIDTVPIHREPIESPRPDLVEKWPANGFQRNFYRLDQNNAKTQQESTALAQKRGFDTVMTTGRQVEHQGGGAESRSNVFLADLQPHMYAEIHPADAEAMGIDGGDLVIVETTDRGSGLMKARVTNRPKENEVFLPFHWGGIHEGTSLYDKYPDGNEPFAIGESANSFTTRGYDAETQMQETKPALVKVSPATKELANKLGMGINPEKYTFPQDEDDFGIQKDFDVRDWHTVQ